MIIKPTANILLKQDAGTDINFDISAVDATDGGSGLPKGIEEQGALSTTAAALLTTPATGHTIQVSDLTLSNTGALQRTITVYRPEDGTTVTAATMRDIIVLAANEYAEWTPSGWVLYDANHIPKVAQSSSPGKVVHLFNGTTTYTPTAGARALYVEAVGGGASGGGAGNAATNAAAASGGGGGAYSAVYTTTIKTSFTVAIGAGGAAPAAGNNSGNVGGDTTFDSASICTAKGGAAGLGRAVTAGPVIGGGSVAGGASASGVGDIKADGGPGGWGVMLAAAQAHSGNGGDSAFGGGGKGIVSATAGGTAGGLYGGGGSGACIISGGASQAGGAGGNGLLRVTELF